MGRFTLYDDEEIVGHAQWQAWCDGWCGGSRRRAVQAFLFHDFWCQVAIASLVAVNATLRARVAAAIALAEDPYGDAVQAMAGDEPLAVGRKIAAAIRAVVVRDEEKA